MRRRHDLSQRSRVCAFGEVSRSVTTLFLLSPANLSGRRGQQLLAPSASFALATQLRSAAGAPLGELFTFVSGLYFRGKLGYARTFGEPWVMTAGGGLLSPDERVAHQRMQGWANVDIHEHNPHFTAPLVRQLTELVQARPAEDRFVLLGSIATGKYLTPLLEVLGDRLLYPEQFRGLGDMSRGSLLLRAVERQTELSYARANGA